MLRVQSDAIAIRLRHRSNSGDGAGRLGAGQGAGLWSAIERAHGVSLSPARWGEADDGDRLGPKLG